MPRLRFRHRGVLPVPQRTAPRPSLCARQGFTIVELVVATVILAVIAGSVGKAVTMMMAMNHKAQASMQSQEATRAGTELARGVPFDNLPIGTFVFRINGHGALDPNGTFYRVTTVTLVASGQKRVTTSVIAASAYTP